MNHEEKRKSPLCLPQPPPTPAVARGDRKQGSYSDVPQASLGICWSEEGRNVLPL